MSRDSESDLAKNGTGVTRRGALKGLGGVVVGSAALGSSASTGAVAYETDPNADSNKCGPRPSPWKDHGEYDTQFPSGTTHHVCSVLDLTHSHYEPKDENQNIDDYWIHEFQFSSQVSAVETESGDPTDKLRSQGVRIKNNNTTKVPVRAAKGEQNNALAPQSNNPDNVEDFNGAVISAAGLAITLAEKTQAALVLSGAQLANSLGQIAYDKKTPDDSASFIWEGGYSGIERGAHQVVFSVANYLTSSSDTPPVQISAHAGQAYTGWDLKFSKCDVSTSGKDGSSSEAQGPMGDPRKMSKAEKEEFGIKEVQRSQLAKEVGEHRIQTENERVYVAEDPPISATPMSREESKKLWE